MPEPVTIAAVAIGGLSWLWHSTIGAAAIGGAIGNPVDRLVAVTLRSLNSRIASLRGLPENHDSCARRTHGTSAGIRTRDPRLSRNRPAGVEG
jgi:hypothetical protein